MEENLKRRGGWGRP